MKLPNGFTEPQKCFSSKGCFQSRGGHDIGPRDTVTYPRPRVEQVQNDSRQHEGAREPDRLHDPQPLIGRECLKVLSKIPLSSTRPRRSTCMRAKSRTHGGSATWPEETRGGGAVAEAAERHSSEFA